jgi:hypothetical protein
MTIPLLLAYRRPLSFIPEVALWDLEGIDRIQIVPFIDSADHSQPPNIRRAATTQAISTLGHFDHSFWTDASLLESHVASAVCVTHQHISDPETHPK